MASVASICEDASEDAWCCMRGDHRQGDMVVCIGSIGYEFRGVGIVSRDSAQLAVMSYLRTCFG